MTFALVLLWAATAQTEGPAATPPPAVVVLQCPPQSCDDSKLKEELEDARRQLAGARDAAGMPDHAVAALLVSDRPDLASLKRAVIRRADQGTRKATIAVYVSPRPEETMVAILMTLKNSREDPAWEPREAWVKVEPPPYRWEDFGKPVRWGPNIPAAVRSNPQRIAPGQSAQIALVFDRADVGLDKGPVVVELLRSGQWEFAFELQPSDVQVCMSKDGDAQ